MTTNEIKLLRENQKVIRTSISCRDYLIRGLKLYQKDKGVTKTEAINKAIEDFLRKHRYLDANGRIIYG